MDVTVVQELQVGTDLHMKTCEITDHNLNVGLTPGK